MDQFLILRQYKTKVNLKIKGVKEKFRTIHQI